MSFRGGDIYNVLHLIDKICRDRTRDLDSADPEIVAMKAAQIATMIPQPLFLEGCLESGDTRLERPTPGVIARLLTGYAHHFAREYQVQTIRERRQRRYCVLRGGLLPKDARLLPLSRYQRPWVI